MRVALVLLAFAFASGAAPAQVRVAVDAVGGVTLNQLGNQNQVTVLGQTIPGFQARYPLSAGASGGLRMRAGTERLALRLGAGAFTTGSVFDVTSVLAGRDDLSLTLASGTLELELGERLGPVHVYAFGGPELRVRLGEAEGGGPLRLGDVDRYQAALGIGSGVRFRLAGLELGPEVRGAFGLGTFSDDRFEFGPLDLAVDEGFTLDNLTVQFAVGRRL